MIRVFDESGNEVNPTYPKRARGLVKQGRARWADDADDVIVLTSDIRNTEAAYPSEVHKVHTLEDTEMFEYNVNEEITEIVNEILEQIEAEAPEKATKNPSLGITELTYNGKTQSIAAWADEVGLARPALYDRINRHGWTVEEALTIPKGGRRKKAEVEGQVAMDEIDE